MSNGNGFYAFKIQRKWTWHSSTHNCYWKPCILRASLNKNSQEKTVYSKKKKKKSGTLSVSGQVEEDGPKNDSRNSEEGKVGIKSEDYELWKRQDTRSEKSSQGKTEKSPGFIFVVLGDLFESLSDGKAQWVAYSQHNHVEESDCEEKKSCGSV